MSLGELKLMTNEIIKIVFDGHNWIVTDNKKNKEKFNQFYKAVNKADRLYAKYRYAKE